jgi:20S proteasome alpha/beta subunit
VTIIVGIITKDQIILASDSQTTYGNLKRLDVQKISVVEFSNTCALVAESGAAEQSGMAVELLKQKAKGKALADYAMVAELAQESLREVRNYLIDLNKGCNFSDEKWERYFRDDNQVELMVANYFNEKPYIYTVNLHTCTASKAKLHYEAIGCGANLGDYLLSELTHPNMDNNLASAIAVYVVESVKKHDPYCGGNTKVALLNMQPGEQPEVLALPYPHVPYYAPSHRIFSTDEVEKLVKVVSEMDSKTKKQRVKIIQVSLFKESEKFFKELYKESRYAKVMKGSTKRIRQAK